MDSLQSKKVLQTLLAWIAEQRLPLTSTLKIRKSAGEDIRDSEVFLAVTGDGWEVKVPASHVENVRQAVARYRDDHRVWEMQASEWHRRFGPHRDGSFTVLELMYGEAYREPGTYNREDPLPDARYFLAESGEIRLPLAVWQKFGNRINAIAIRLIGKPAKLVEEGKYVPSHKDHVVFPDAPPKQPELAEFLEAALKEAPIMIEEQCPLLRMEDFIRVAAAGSYGDEPGELVQALITLMVEAGIPDRRIRQLIEPYVDLVEPEDMDGNPRSDSPSKIWNDAVITIEAFQIQKEKSDEAELKKFAAWLSERGISCTVEDGGSDYATNCFLRLRTPDGEDGKEFTFPVRSIAFVRQRVEEWTTVTAERAAYLSAVRGGEKPVATITSYGNMHSFFLRDDEVSVPQNVVARMIGRQGENIKYIAKRLGMNFIKVVPTERNDRVRDKDQLRILPGELEIDKGRRRWLSDYLSRR